jgi:antitoxin component HigA of HigAB toxin-antitoxin module
MHDLSVHFITETWYQLIRGVLSANKRLKLNSATNDKDNVFSDDASADLYERELEQIHTTLARSHDQVALTNISKHVCKIIETQARSCEADNDLEEWLNKMSQKDNFKPDKFEGYDQLVQDIYKSYETTYSVPRLVRERYVYLKEPYTKDELQERMNEQLYSVLRLYIHKRRLKQQDQSKRLGACLSSDQHRDGRRNATVAIIKKIVPIFIVSPQ